LEEAVLFEEMGYSLYPGPYFSTVARALPAVSRDPGLLAKVVSGEAAASFAEAGVDAPTLVPDLLSVDLVIAVADAGNGTELFAVETEGSSKVADVSTMDRTRRFGSITLDSPPGRTLANADETPGLLEAIRLRTLSALALEAVGVAQFALDTAQNYVKERKQFEKPIGSYQAVSHQVSNTYMDTELARSLAYWAAWAVAEGDERAGIAVAAAHSLASETAVTACERSIQVHGGIGFTWEHILHRYYKRAEWISSFGGSGPTHRRVIAKELLS
jgi:alkylation response protein AidB-like acyl-CoA dehydrogenase